MHLRKLVLEEHRARTVAGNDQHAGLVGSSSPRLRGHMIFSGRV